MSNRTAVWLPSRASLRLAAGLLAVAMARPAAPQAVPRGLEFQVNAFTPGRQRRPDVGVRDDGGFVVVWSDYDERDGSELGVFGRRFSSAGPPLGVDFQVNVYTTGIQTVPQIGVRDDGGFVVAWISLGQDGTGGGVFARRFDSSGAALGGEFQVNTYTESVDGSVAIAVHGGGAFVIASTGAIPPTSSRGAVARRFDATGAAIGVEIQISTYPSAGHRAVTVGMDGAGGFVVAWESVGQDGDDYGIFGRRVAPNGVPLAGEFQVNSYTVDRQHLVGIGVDSTGAFGVTWRGYDQAGTNRDVFARLFGSTGVPVAADFMVNTYTSGSQGGSRLAFDPTGAFVVVWGSDQDGSGYGVFARKFDSAAVAIGSELQINTYTPLSQAVPRLDINDEGDFVVVWSSLGGQDGDLDGVFARRFERIAALDLDGDGSTGALTDGLLLLRHLFGFTGSTLTGGAVDLADCSRCDADSIASYVDQPLAVTPSGDELQVNTYTSEQQSLPAVGMDADGAFVIAWNGATDEDGSNVGVFARRFDAAGVPIGAQFQVNTYTTGYQRDPAVAMDTAGDFVVAWTSAGQDSGADGVFARRFNSSGAGQGPDFQVNSYTTSGQGRAAVAMNAAGAFAVTWQSSGQDGAKWGVFARRFNAGGAGVGLELQVNEHTANDQVAPAVGMDSTGAFVVAWTSTSQEGYFDGVFGRRFDAAGVAVGGEFQVNAFTLDDQQYPAVSMRGGGSFVVAWQSNTQDGYGLGVFARRFDAAGTPIGAELQVNQYTTDAQSAPMVATDGSGFVVVWHSEYQDGSSFGVFARRFDDAASDFAPELRVNTTVASSQRAPAVAVDAKRRFVVAWQSYPQDGSLNGIFARRFATLSIFDIDGNGALDALTDGLLALRFLFGFTGPALVNGAVGSGCTRCTAPAIEAHLATLI